MLLVIIIKFEFKEIIMNSVKQTTVALALGAVVLTAGVSTSVEANPFGFEQMNSGYQLDGGDKKAKEGKCGEGKCGGDMKKAAGKAAEGKCGEGKCGGDMKKAAEGKAKEGKCGEGKCGGAK